MICSLFLYPAVDANKHSNLKFQMIYESLTKAIRMGDNETFSVEIVSMSMEFNLLLLLLLLLFLLWRGSQ
jgi:hypothetical protein